MAGEGTVAANHLGRLVARHSFTWLVAANLIGLWLATVLVWPALGDFTAPFSYGRWMPLHLNWQLYGWCALPLAGVLLAWSIDPRHPDATKHTRLALGAWSAALIVGGATWLAGLTSGKLFLDWHGWARPVLPVAMSVLWTIVATHTWWRWQQFSFSNRALRGVLLTLLLPVPALLYWSAGRDVYPAVNPDSGGATGASLLGSTLGVVTIFGLLPLMLGRTRNRSTSWFWWLLVGSWCVYAMINHGHASHHSTGQIVSLAVLIPWIPLFFRYTDSFSWSREARPWLYAAGVWWLLLVLTGWFSFLPGFSERLKFTNALVAHAHLAMAGLVTSVNIVVLSVLSGRGTSKGSFWLWQCGCAIYVLAMAVLGWTEAENASGIFLGESPVQVFYLGRLIAGVAMTAASGQWLVETWKT